LLLVSLSLLKQFESLMSWQTSFAVLAFASATDVFAQEVSFDTQADVPARRLTTSTQCRAALDYMLRDPNWLVVNESSTRWCRVRLENKMALCCKLATFSYGAAEGCSSCLADCQHSNMVSLCNSYFGKACNVQRKPFFKTGGPDVDVLETFCVPTDCDNTADRDSLMAWYAAIYAGRRTGWTLDYDSAILQCPGAVTNIIIAVVSIIVILLGGIPLGIILFKAPKERDRTAVSQAENLDQAHQEFQDDPQLGDTAFTLRGAALGDGTINSFGGGTSFGASTSLR
jgi:hypothetical protein